MVMGFRGRFNVGFRILERDFGSYGNGEMGVIGFEFG